MSLDLFSVGKRYGPGYEAGMFNITDDYSLVIKDVKVQDEGIYICSFSDYQTGIIFRNSTRVSVQGKTFKESRERKGEKGNGKTASVRESFHYGSLRLPAR